MSNQSNYDRLHALYKNEKSARAVLDHFASRERNWRITSVDRILTNLASEGEALSRADVISVFRELETFGYGTFVAGRKGWPSRFEWQAKMVDVGRAATGEIEQVEDLSEDEVGEEEAGSVKHIYRLRSDVTISFELPSDFNSNEAHRVARFVETLPFQQASNETR